MSMIHHAVIDAFLQQQTITRLWEDVQANTSYQYNKSGVVPFIVSGGTFLYYVTKPRGKAPGLGKASFQICKGTRQYKGKDGRWHDIRSEEAQHAETKETLASTALREGNEELGLILDNIAALWDLGAFCFTSATTGKPKYMWLFAAKMHDKDRFLADHEVKESTQERCWVDLDEFAVVGRQDHVYILRQIEPRLRALFPRPLGGEG